MHVPTQRGHLTGFARFTMIHTKGNSFSLYTGVPKVALLDF